MSTATYMPKHPVADLVGRLRSRQREFFALRWADAGDHKRAALDDCRRYEDEVLDAHTGTPTLLGQHAEAMIRHQRKFFASRHPADRREALDAERRVDAELARLKELATRTLFDLGGES